MLKPSLQCGRKAKEKKMNLTDLKPAEGANRKRKRVGRGRASGHGKTSTRGANGQGQRSGEGRRFGFEGGQTPLFRRLPKIHNFDAAVKFREWELVNVGSLNEFASGTEVNADTLVEKGILRKITDSLRILGAGDLKVALKVSAHHVSAGARTKIEAAGGTVTLLGPETPTRKHRLPKVKNPADPSRNPPKEEAKKEGKEGKDKKDKEKSKEPSKDKAKEPSKEKAKEPAQGKAKEPAKDKDPSKEKAKPAKDPSKNPKP
jgi:large subunit ribosomal protein L15